MRKWIYIAILHCPLTYNQSTDVDISYPTSLLFSFWRMVKRTETPETQYNEALLYKNLGMYKHREVLKQ